MANLTGNENVGAGNAGSAPWGLPVGGVASPGTGSGDGYDPNANKGLPPAGPGTGTGTKAPVNGQLARQTHWSDALFEHYLGKDATPAEIQWIIANGMTPESLTQHLRAQASYIKGLSIGALEDYHTNAKPAWDKWLGTQATDDDIRDLMNRGIKDPQQIEDYLTNRPDVVAQHPGAPLKLSDQEFGIKKNQVDSEYLQNLGKTATNQEALKALQDQAHGPAARQSFDLSSNEKENSQGALTTPNIIAPNARSLA